MSSHGMRDGDSVGERVMDAVTRNPEGLLLLGAGIALLLRSGLATDRRAGTQNFGGRQYAGPREVRQSSEGLTEQVGAAARRAGDYVSEATEKAAETARSYASSATDYAGEVGAAAMERSQRLAGQAWETTDDLVREQPWAVALVGLAAGAAVAAIFPSTRIEGRALGQVGQRLRSAAGNVGEQLMEAGLQAGERLGEVAEERGLNSEGLKEAARDVGETFRTALAGEDAGSDRPQAKPQGGRPQSGTTQAKPASGSDATSGGRR